MSIAKRIFFDLPGFGRVHSTDGSIKLSGFKRIDEISDVGPAGFSKEYEYGELKFKVKNQPGISIKALHALENINVTVTDDNGKVWQCSGAFSSDLPTLNGGDIDVTMKFPSEEEI